MINQNAGRVQQAPDLEGVGVLAEGTNVDVVARAGSRWMLQRQLLPHMLPTLVHVNLCPTPNKGQISKL